MAKAKTSFFKSPVFLVILGLFGALLLAILFLPQLSSTSFISEKLKSTINEAAPGTVDYEQMKLSWMGGLQIEKLQYGDKAMGVEVKIDEVTSSKGLLSLAMNYKDTGTIEVVRPVITVDLQEKPAKVEPPAPAPAKKESTKSAEKTTSSKPSGQAAEQSLELPPLPPINVQLVVSDGTLLTAEADQTQKAIIENLNLSVNVDGPAGTAAYELSLKNGQASGLIQGSGNVSLGRENPANIDSLMSDAQIEIADWQIADLLTLAASRSNAPEGEGVINGALQLKANGVSELNLTGDLEGTSIRLKNGALGTDTPTIDKFTLALDTTKSGENIAVENLDISSPFLTAKLLATLQKTQLKTLSTTADVHVAEILSQFPATLQLQEGMKVTEGKLHLDATADNSDGTTEFKAHTTLQDLSGVVDKKKIQLRQPVDVVLEGSENKGAVNFEVFSVKSSFLQANGKGNMDAMTVAAQADIGKALAEVRQFVDLGAISSSGKLQLGLAIDSKPDDIRAVSGNLKVDGFELKDGKTTISPKDSLAVNFASLLKLENETQLKEVGKSSLAFDTWLGKGSLNLDGVSLPENDTPASINNGVFAGAFNLKRLTNLLHSLEKLPKEQKLSGTVDVDATIGGKDLDHPSVAAKLNIAPFKFVKGDKSFSEKNLSIEIEADTDLLQKNYSLKKLNISTTPLQLSMAASLLSDNNEQIAEAKGDSTISLEVLSEQLQSLADLKLSMTGTSETPLTLRTWTTGGEWKDLPKNTEFSTSVQADSIVGYGLNIEALTLPVQLKSGIGEIDVNARVNRGSLTITPKVDFTGQYPVASLPDNSAILKDVGLTGDMSNDLLAKIHPLFKGVASTAGTISMDVEHFHWPVGEAQQKDVSFSSSIIFNDVQLQAGALLTPLLALIKEDERSILLGEKPMTCIGKDERVTCSPLEATVNEYYLILEGSVGFDQSLDYIAKVPVTRKMVSSKIYKYLEGTYINVPIKGTVSKPKISNSVLQDALSDLVIQAGKKELSDQAGKLLKGLFN